VCKKGLMSPLLIEGDRRANHMLPAFRHAQLILGLSIYTLSAAQWMPVGQLICGLGRTAVSALSLCVFCIVGLLILFARWSGVSGAGFAMALNRIFTSSPIQSYKIRGILRANRAPALVHEQLAVV
jgi:hypothetical protein